MVKESNDTIELIGSVARKSATLVKSLKSLLPIISDGVASTSQPGSYDQKVIHRLTLRASDSRDQIVMYDRAITGAISYLNGLDQSLHGSPRPSSKKHDVTISVLVRQRGFERKT